MSQSLLDLLKAHNPELFDKEGNFKFADFRTALAEADSTFSQETYRLDWRGKSYAKALVYDENRTLLSANHSHNANNLDSQNVLIQGDNLAVLKHLREAYRKQIKMIYIDPPYNTGSDGFVYQDDRKYTPEQIAQITGESEEYAEYIHSFINAKASSHSAWLTFMYPRLKLARELLKDDGVIFISIDDNEQAQLKLLCDEIFGEGNFINSVSINMKNIAGASGGGEDKRLKKNIETLLIYAKSYDNLPAFKNIYNYIEIGNLISNYEEMGKSWKYTSVLLDKGNEKYVGSTIDGDGNEIKIFLRENYKICSVSELSKKEQISEQEVYKKYASQIFQTALPQSSIRPRVMDYVSENGIVGDLYSIQYVPKSGRNKGKVYEQFYKGSNFRLFAWLKDVSEEVDGELYKKEILGTFWDFVAETKNLTKEGGIPYPNGKKPLKLIKQLVDMTTSDDDYVLDFFAGSGTTAHAVMQLNVEDGMNRRFILVQIDESLDDNLKQSSGESKKAIQNLIDILDEVKRPHYISEVTKERLIRSANQIKEKNPAYTGDLGFKEYRIVPTPDNFGILADNPAHGLQLLENLQLSDTDCQNILTTWCVQDGMPLHHTPKQVDLGGYIAYRYDTVLYLLNKGFDTKHLAVILRRLDDTTDEFNIDKIVILEPHFDSKAKRELTEAIGQYKPRKGNKLYLVVRNRADKG
ncbi:site-specific DNA-methyltransferase [Glaesserella parasuis]